VIFSDSFDEFHGSIWLRECNGCSYAGNGAVHTLECIAFHRDWRAGGALLVAGSDQLMVTNSSYSNIYTIYGQVHCRSSSSRRRRRRRGPCRQIPLLRVLSC
jgi:hypothetical protein